jgi:hypothetical protein
MYREKEETKGVAGVGEGRVDALAFHTLMDVNVLQRLLFVGLGPGVRGLYTCTPLSLLL